MRHALALLFILSLAGCGRGGPVPPPDPGPETSAVGSAAPQSSPPGLLEAIPPSTEATTKILFLGDSLSAGYGLATEQAFPALAGELLKQRGFAVEVVNAGVSGDTTAGGLARIGWLLRQQPAVVVVELGGNDGLRGFDTAVTEENLRQIIRRCQGAGAAVLLAGMQMPPNYGANYQRLFADLYPRLAKEFAVPLIPFLLEGVGGDPALNQPDGIHPTAEGQERIAQTVATHLARMLP